MKFEKLDRLPPYVLAIVNDLKLRARRAGEDVIDLGFGNPNHATPAHVVEKLVEAARDSRNHHYSASRGLPERPSQLASSPSFITPPAPRYLSRVSSAMTLPNSRA